MKKWMTIAAAVFAVWGAARADELLDSVLGWDQPATWSKREPAAPAAAPGPAASAGTVPGKAAETDDLLDAVLGPEMPTVPPEKAPARKVPEKPVPVKRTPAPDKMTDAIAKPAPKPTAREERVEQDVRISEARAERSEAAWNAGEATTGFSGKGKEGENEEEDRSAAAMEKSKQLSVRGGGGGDGAVACSGEFTMPLGKSMFDLSLRGGYAQVDYTVERSFQDTYYTHYTTYSYYTSQVGWHSYSYSVPHYHTVKHTRTIYYTETESTGNCWGEAVALWRPFRGQRFSPYAGAGVRYEKSEEEDGGRASLCGRVGARLNLGRWWLEGEFDGGEESTELTGTLGWRFWKHVALRAGVVRFEAKGADGERHDGIAGGGGLAWVF